MAPESTSAAVIPTGSLTQMSKLYKWKKINYKTFLPKHAPVVVYIVAKANTFDRHGVALSAVGRTPSTSATTVNNNHNRPPNSTNN